MDGQDKKVRTLRYVHAAEAEDRLLELLRCVEKGDTIVITRHGKKVAHLTPPDEEREREIRKEFWDEFKRRRATWKMTKMTTQEILALRHDDHQRAQRKEAMEELMRLRSQWELTPMTTQEILDLRHEGHRF